MAKVNKGGSGMMHDSECLSGKVYGHMGTAPKSGIQPKQGDYGTGSKGGSGYSKDKSGTKSK